MLMEYVDITNAGTYDFLYLRIDFQNKCKYIYPYWHWHSVGYAFINFIDPLSVIPFAKARVGTKWFSPFFSTELTLGTVSIPTKSATSHTPISKEKNVSLRNSEIVASWMKILPIVLKFSNQVVLSWVMNKSLYTPIMTSTNFRFPEPNNARRKLRSIACARQIGISTTELTIFRTFSPRGFEETWSLIFFLDLRFCDLDWPFFLLLVCCLLCIFECVLAYMDLELRMCLQEQCVWLHLLFIAYFYIIILRLHTFIWCRCIEFIAVDECLDILCYPRAINCSSVGMRVGTSTTKLRGFIPHCSIWRSLCTMTCSSTFYMRMSSVTPFLSTLPSRAKESLSIWMYKWTHWVEQFAKLNAATL